MEEGIIGNRIESLDRIKAGPHKGAGVKAMSLAKPFFVIPGLLDKLEGAFADKGFAFGGWLG